MKLSIVDESAVRPQEAGPLRAGFERVVIVGTSCSGKTTLARELARVLESTAIELDALHWLPNWVESTLEDFRARTEQAVAAERWVADGNYGQVRDLVWGRATTVVWLDYPFPIVAWRAVSRTFRRALTGERLYAGNRESLRKAFLSKDSILLWVLQTFRENRRKFPALRADPAWKHLAFHQLRHPREAEALVARLAAAR